MDEENMQAKINSLYKQSLYNMQHTDDPSLADEVIICQHNIIDNLRSMLLEYGFEKQIMETRLEIARKEILQFKEQENDNSTR